MDYPRAMRMKWPKTRYKNVMEQKWKKEAAKQTWAQKNDQNLNFLYETIAPL